MLRRSLSYLMEGKVMMNHQHSKKDNCHSLTESYLKVTMTTIRSLTAIPILMASIATSDSLEGLWSATCTTQPSQGKFADAGCLTSSKAPLSPDGNFGVKNPIFWRDFSRNPFVVQNRCPCSCTPKSFSGYSQARRPCPSF